MYHKLLNRLVIQFTILVMGCTISGFTWAVVDKAPPCRDVFANQPMSAQYNVHSNGTLTDRSTGYTWFRCSAGQIWADGQCKGYAIMRNFEDAQDWAAQAQVAGLTNWRVPKIEEMNTLVQPDCRSPSIDIKAFPGIEPENYWSNKENFWIGSMAWSLFFFQGHYYSRQGKVFEQRFMLIQD